MNNPFFSLPHHQLTDSGVSNDDTLKKESVVFQKDEISNWWRGLIGHDKVKQFLTNSLEKGQIAHAYLFCGPENMGKTKAAASFSAALLGQREESRIPNPESRNQESSDDFQFLKNNPDFTAVERVVNAKTGKLSQNITINQIRELGARLQSTSFLGGRKVAVIKEGDLMNTESANAFLKNLEEPRGDTVIIILASDLNNLPVTIVSRCQIVRFHQVKPEIVKKHLINLGASRGKAESIVYFSGAKPGLALRIFKDNDLFEFYQKQTENFAKILKWSLSERLDYCRKTLGAAEVEKMREKMYNILNVWEAAARRLMSQTLDAAAVEKIHLATLQIRANVNPKLVMENLLINLHIKN